MPDGHNQSPNDLCSDLTTRSDLGRLANARLQREHRLSDPDGTSDTQIIPQPPAAEVHEKGELRTGDGVDEKEQSNAVANEAISVGAGGDPGPKKSMLARGALKTGKVMKTYTKFMGPGFMVAVVSLVNPTLHQRQALM